jgi:sugar (pentulose or hexulose) kinase
MSAALLLLGVDGGTIGAKALFVDVAGRIVAEHTVGYDVLTPRPLWAEHCSYTVRSPALGGR